MSARAHAAADERSAFQPNWDVHPSVRVLITTRDGGVSRGPFSAFNLGAHVGDEPGAVAANRARLREWLPADPRWLEQVHGVDVIDAGAAAGLPRADAAIARRAGVVCAILTADCLPILLAADDGSVVGAAHAGWRGLAAGVVEATVAQMAAPRESVSAYLGPAIAHYEVGEDVRAAFLGHDAGAAAAFTAAAQGKYWCDLYALARGRLAAAGVARVAGGTDCTWRDATRFYSYRREGRTGRMASLVWLAAPAGRS